MNKIYNTLARLTKKKRLKYIKSKLKVKTTTDTVEIQTIIRDYHNNYMPINWIT